MSRCSQPTVTAPLGAAPIEEVLSYLGLPETFTGATHACGAEAALPAAEVLAPATGTATPDVPPTKLTTSALATIRIDMLGSSAGAKPFLDLIVLDRMIFIFCLVLPFRVEFSILNDSRPFGIQD